MTAQLLLASECCDKHDVSIREVTRGLVLALTPGEGPSRNPKHQPNEDSVGAVPIPGGWGVVVADSHWGAHAGEALVRAVTAGLPGLAASLEAPEALARWLVVLDAAFRRGRPAGDRSETTLLVALARGRRVVFASIADSYLYVLGGKPAARRVNLDRPLFAGCSPPLAAYAERAGLAAIVDWGVAELSPGQVLLVASDGIGQEDSNLAPDDLARGLLATGPLSARVRALVDRARSAALGGGRDNVGLVVLDPDAG